MKLLLLTFGFGVLSSSVPVFNMEAYLALRGPTARRTLGSSFDGSATS